ncbi:MAG: gliding motility-associated C-terminal domain-containing protein [Bacteroidota bacterium]
MKKFIYIFQVLFFISGLFPNKLLATHIAAVNITYDGIDTFQYIITVRIYRDCGTLQGVQQPFIEINYESVSCSASGTANLFLITGDLSGNPGEGNFIELPCLGIDTCDNLLPGYAVEEFVYQDTIILPQVCSDWVISHETQGLRNISYALVDPLSQTTYVSALLNNIDAPGNNSPTFEKPPIAIFCVGRQFFFDQGAIETDGDSIVYFLSPAQGSLSIPNYNGDTLIYVSPYNYTTPFDILSPPLNMDFENGIISFTPTDTIISVMCVLIEEYNSNGVLIGSIKNDMQVVISDSGGCIADTLNFTCDTTTPTGTHPAISALCSDTLIKVFFDNPIQCESVADDGSDFILVNPLGDTIPINSATLFDCSGGLTDTVVLHLYGTFAIPLNGSYYIYSSVGTDGNPVLSACDLPLNDTLEVRYRDCPAAYVDLKNVSVVNNDNIEITWQTYTENFPDTFFVRYDVFRSGSPAGLYNFIGTKYIIEDTVFNDAGVDVSANVYNYAVKLFLKVVQLDTLSDSIQSILLIENPAQPDTAHIQISWTPYWGWSSSQYHIMESVAYGAWKEIVTTTSTSYTYTKSLLANIYRLKIETRDNNSSLISESNWIEFEIPVRNMPNVFTPNGDGINDVFFVNELLLYGNAHLKVYNRWGIKIFEDEDYRNDWEGTGWWGKTLEYGTYFYSLSFSDGPTRHGFVTIIR